MGALLVFSGNGCRSLPNQEYNEDGERETGLSIGGSVFEQIVAQADSKQRTEMQVSEHVCGGSALREDSTVPVAREALRSLLFASHTFIVAPMRLKCF